MGLERAIKPIHWSESKASVIYSLALLGATEPQMAEILEISVETLKYWKKHHPEVLRALNEGRLGADAKVAEALYRCAIGYQYDDQESRVIGGKLQTVTVKRTRPADPWAAARWLSLRQRQSWSETQRVEISQVNTNINIDYAQLTTEQLKVLEEIALTKRLNAGDSDIHS